MTFVCKKCKKVTEGIANRNRVAEIITYGFVINGNEDERVSKRIFNLCSKCYLKQKEELKF